MKRLLFSLIAAATLIGASAETVPQKHAMLLAQDFFNEANGRVMAPVKMVYNGRHLTTNRLFVPFYVYNQPAGGFVIISAENKTFPILGYSLKENFDPDHMGPKEKALLTSYARDIEMIRYDSTEPTEAIKAWQDYPHYIKRILDAPYDATDPTMTMEEATTSLDWIVESGQAEETASDIFTPQQWTEQVDRELTAAKSVAVGLVKRGDFTPIIIHGRKGDYYRMQLDKPNRWLMRLLPSEVLSGIQIAAFSHPEYIDLPESEDMTYRLADDFNREVEEEQELLATSPMTEQSPWAMDAMAPVDGPVVNGIGGGHYEILLPENVVMMTVYGLGGEIRNIRTFKSTNVAHADLSIEPAGFYFALLIGESGRPYGVKLAR